ncbi:hypothetical protein C8Q75DRAFT_267143, partial [Abortiporus biennis]
MSTNDKLKVIASTTLNALFSSRKVDSPLSSFDLLAAVISYGPLPGVLPDEGRPLRFRLTDLGRFETILQSLSQHWDFGKLTLSREGPSGDLTVLDVRLGQGHSKQSAICSPSAGKKRKRVTDEDADSATECVDEEGEREQSKPAPSTLDSLSKATKEIYSLLQRGTAKGRLLAEQFHSLNGSFEPICPHITKDECAKARRAAVGDSSASAIPTICDRVHFRPLIRPHTDPTLGHCSYLNTCYSEPTYAQSPSIPPLPSHRAIGYGQQGGQGAVSLPSGLGAGGRGKEKAPCRYLHFEVDWDGGDGLPSYDNKSDTKKKPYRLNLGLG